MLRPVADLATIQDRQDTVQLLVDARDVAAALQGILKKVREVKERVCGRGKVQRVQAQEEGTAGTGAGAGGGYRGRGREWGQGQGDWLLGRMAPPSPKPRPEGANERPCRFPLSSVPQPGGGWLCMVLAALRVSHLHLCSPRSSPPPAAVAGARHSQAAATTVELPAQA